MAVNAERSVGKIHLGIGLVGFGNMGKTHAYAVKNLPFFYPGVSFRAAIAGVCVTDPARASDYAAQYDLGTPAASFDQLLALPGVDVIDICTPNNTHYDLICRALEAGKHVLCEKPLCVTPEEARDIARREAQSGLTCGMVFNNRFMAPIMRAKQFIEDGRLGRILSFRISYDHNTSTFADRAPGWKQKGDFGGGVLFDLGSHVIDLISYLCGPIDTVEGLSQIAFPRHGAWETNADEAFYLLAKLRCGACGTIVANKLATGACDDLNLEIFGERGSLKYALSSPEWLYFYDNDRPSDPIGGERGFTRIECGGRYPLPGGQFPSPKATVGWLRCHVASMYEFLQCVSENVPFSPSLAEGAYVQEVMRAAVDSDRDGTRKHVGWEDGNG